MSKLVARIPMLFMVFGYGSGRIIIESMPWAMLIAAAAAVLPIVADLYRLRTRYSMVAAAKTVIMTAIFVLIALVLDIASRFPNFQRSIQTLSKSENWRIVAIEYIGPTLASNPTIVLWREYVVCGHAVRLKNRTIDLVRPLDRVVMVESDVYVYDIVGAVYIVHRM